MNRRQLAVALIAIVAVVSFAVVLLAFAAYSALDRPSWIYYYRVVDDRTLVAGTVSGPNANVRVTSVVETVDSVTITVSSFFFRIGPSTDLGYSYESEAKLQAPLGERIVIDGSNGRRVERATCLPPSVFASPCAPGAELP